MPRRTGACLILLAAPALAVAGRYQPEPKWLEAVRAPQPFLPYRLGVVEFKKGLSDEWREYLGDFRASLRGANLFQHADGPRLRVEIEQGYQHGSSNEDGCKETPGTLALTYRFMDGDREVTRLSIATRAPVSGDSNDWDAAMAGNLKFLLLELRKGQGDARFAQVASGFEARIREELGTGSNIGCTAGAVLARGFVATVEGAAAVVGGLGEVAGTALEVAASPQFQGALDTAMAEHQQQRAQQQAFQNTLQAQARPSPAPAPGATHRSPAPAPASNLGADRETAGVGTRPAAGAAVQGDSAAVPGKPLRFVMTISMRNLPGDKVNPTCYSNLISRPGPPGWGAPGFLPPGSGEQARATVFGLKSAFIARCRASGRDITSDGNFNFQWNQSSDDEQRLQQTRARYAEDVAVTL